MKGLIKAYYELASGGKVSRKQKKLILGVRRTKSKLRRMCREVVLGKEIKTMYERRKIMPYGPFCPDCGCHNYTGSGNMAEYPEHWEKFYCLRCDRKVGVIDNSPFYHMLEFEDLKAEI